MKQLPQEKKMIKWQPFTSKYLWCDPLTRLATCSTVLESTAGARLAWRPDDAVTSDEVALEVVMRTLEKTFQVFENVLAFSLPCELFNGQPYCAETYRIFDFDEIYDEKEPEEFIESVASGIVDFFVKNKPSGCDTIAVYNIQAGSPVTIVRMKYIL